MPVITKLYYFWCHISKAKILLLFHLGLVKIIALRIRIPCDLQEIDYLDFFSQNWGWDRNHMSWGPPNLIIITTDILQVKAIAREGCTHLQLMHHLPPFLRPWLFNPYCLWNLRYYCCITYDCWKLLLMQNSASNYQQITATRIT